MCIIYFDLMCFVIFFAPLFLNNELCVLLLLFMLGGKN